LSSRLNDTYESGYESGYVQGTRSAGNQPISAELKAQLNVQTQQVSKAFEEEKSVELSDALVDPKFVFVVEQAINVKSVDGQKCKLLGADLLRVVGQVPDGASVVDLEVVSSKGNCDAGSTVRVSAKDLQEMLNGYAEGVDEGMHDFEQKQKSGVVPTNRQP
jgi:hypothetical protein